MPSWLLPIIVGWLGGTITAGFSAYASHRWAISRERRAALRERYDKGAAAIKLYLNLVERFDSLDHLYDPDFDEVREALTEVFGHDFAHSALHAVHQPMSTELFGAAYDAMLKRQAELERELGLPPVVDLETERVQLFADRLKRLKRVADAEDAPKLTAPAQERETKKNRARAASDAGQGGDATIDDEEESNRET